MQARPQHILSSTSFRADLRDFHPYFAHRQDVSELGRVAVEVENTVDAVSRAESTVFVWSMQGGNRGLQVSHALARKSNRGLCAGITGTI